MEDGSVCEEVKCTDNERTDQAKLCATGGGGTCMSPGKMKTTRTALVDPMRERVSHIDGIPCGAGAADPHGAVKGRGGGAGQAMGVRLEGSLPHWEGSQQAATGGGRLEGKRWKEGEGQEVGEEGEGDGRSSGRHRRGKDRMEGDGPQTTGGTGREN